MTKKKSFFDKMMMMISGNYPKAESNLSHYPILIVGSNVGGILTRVIAHYDKGETPIFNAYGPRKHRLQALKLF